MTAAKKIVRNRCANRSNVIGSAVVTLDGQVDGRNPIETRFEAGDTVRYTVEEPDGLTWEEIEGLFVAGTPNHLTRVKTLDSSSPSGDPIVFSASPNKLVFVDADDALIGPERGRLNIATTTGTGAAYELDIPVPPQQLKDGVEVHFFVHTDNTQSDVTLKVGNTDAKPLLRGLPKRKLAVGSMKTDALITARYSEAGTGTWNIRVGLLRTVKTIAAGPYTVLEEDHEQILVFTSAAAVAITLPQATLQFVAPFSFDYLAVGAGALTFTPTTSTVNGVATLVANSGQSGSIFTDGGNYRAPGGAAQSPATLWVDGVNISNNVADANNDIDVSTGIARDSGDADFMALAAILTKRLDAAWAVGTNQGGLFTGAKTLGTQYHFFLIKRPDTGVVDAGFDTSVTAANAPANYTLKRRLGTVWTDGSNNIRAIVQYGRGRRRENYLATPIVDVDAANPGTAAVTRTLTVPTGIKVKAIVHAGIYTDAGIVPIAYISDLALADLAPLPVATATVATPGGTMGSQAGAAGNWNWVPYEVWTNTSAQVRSRATITSAASRFSLVTRGWVEEI